MDFIAGVTKHSESIEVFVDGVRVQQCERASSSQGWARAYVMDGIRVVHNGLGRPKFEVIEGKVTYRRENAAAWR